MACASRGVSGVTGCVGVVAVLAGWAVSGSAFAQVAVAPQYASNYTVRALGSVPGVPGPYGGLTLDPNDPDRLLIGGRANNASGAVYSIRVTRNACGAINGFVGQAQLVATAPQIDGGLLFAPNGVLLTSRYPDNAINMIKPGSTSPDKVVSLSPLGVAGSTGSIAIVPPGQPGAGRFKIVPFSATSFYDATLAPDATGTYDVVGVTATGTLQGGPEGIAYVPAGSPLFPVPALIVSEYSAGVVSAYDIDAEGDPIPGTRRLFLTGLGGPEGAFLDASSGDFLFSTFTGSQVYVVEGFAELVRCDDVDFNNDGVFPDDQDLADYLLVLGGGNCPTCNDPDFNNDCVFPDDADLEVYLRVLGGGSC